MKREKKTTVCKHTMVVDIHMRLFHKILCVCLVQPMRVVVFHRFVFDFVKTMCLVIFIPFSFLRVCVFSLLLLLSSLFFSSLIFICHKTRIHLFIRCMRSPQRTRNRNFTQYFKPQKPIPAFSCESLSSLFHSEKQSSLPRYLYMYKNMAMTHRK